MSTMLYNRKKYFKYKNKYLNIKNQYGGVIYPSYSNTYIFRILDKTKDLMLDR